MLVSIPGFLVLAALGLNALADTVGEHLRVLRYAGAAYLVYTGIAMWRAPVTAAARPVKGGIARLFGLGVLLNVSNPKMPVFYLALLPAVLGSHPLSFVDAAIILAVVIAVEALVIGAHVTIALRTKAALAEPRRLRALNRGAGALMVGAGALVASR